MVSIKSQIHIQLKCSGYQILYPMKTAASKCQHIIDDGFVELDHKRCLEQCRLWRADRVAESELLR